VSTLAAVKPYDQVFDAQKHYRTLLECTARPGTIGQLDDAQLDLPPQLNRATALIALALFSNDCSFYLAPGQEAVAEFLSRETLANPVNAEQADFLLLPDANRLQDVSHARLGTLSYPELGATIVLQVAAISLAPISGCLRLALTGPGIESETTVFVVGAPESFFAVRDERNAEFPLGVDVFFTCDSLSAGPCVVVLPRTTQVNWKRM
jgi:alpha-D-ribose 1-methylphosphonate 5-triphosphate synthase subunit PhnH